ncbi:hybrid sensor histidine kinase/response regulator [Chelativorans alearense]|uniref:hybrid sensor histidine kinase/response regulator n=1 Tax=Chelativorans alearense TaxID=2681495 RepID=UPI0013D57D61|nr:ATP-binding protein [Chelativorans alearense]
MARQRILPIRREYNRWVANQTLEDYALRFTAKSARRFSSQRISQTAIGAISFLALEAIGGAITLSYGTANAIAAIVVASIAILAVGVPISRYATRHGLDIDLLTRGAGFGYIGSTVTSLVYASFTFILFAIEASIMTGALRLAFGIPPWIGYIISAVVVIPLVTHGVKLISRFQLLTQPVWIVLNILPFLFIAWLDWEKFDLWRAFPGIHEVPGSISALEVAKFGAASAVILALMTQIGEQVDFLRFLPADGEKRKRYRLGVFLAGPGWVLVGAPKLLAGSFLAVLVLSTGVAPEHASEPAEMYAAAFGYMIPNETLALVLMAIFVVVSQLKINVMNAYAGSLAWSNFFSRLTHSHPGRVVWLVFNVAIALLLMELGIYRLLEATLAIFSIVAMAWLCTVSADLFVNKPLGLAPPGIEFKRAHLYDINPVGLGSMSLSAGIALAAHFGAFGQMAAALAPYIALVTAFIAAPAIAYATGGKYYLARKPRRAWAGKGAITCSICEHPFEPEDMAWCPAYAAPICSLCCSLDARCHDLCKPKANARAQAMTLAESLLPALAVEKLQTRLGKFGMAMVFAVALLGAILALVYSFATKVAPETADVVGGTILVVFFAFSVVAGIVAWFLVLAHDSRRIAEEESARQNTLLLREISAHRKTDAALQMAKEKAEAANRAKSRYVVGLSHELRTPLNAVLGYAQILEREAAAPAPWRSSISVIRRSAEHLSGLIDGLLDISKIETGRLQVYSNEINLYDFLDQIVGMFRLQAEAKGLAFQHKRDPGLPQYVRTDEKRLRQILVNLLSNAIKFTDSGHVDFTVGYRSEVATFRVADSGPGIGESDLEHVFEPFVRGPAERNRLSPGLGLGLTITRLLTETLGGEITVESAPGVGSTFQVRLMLAKVDRPAAFAAQDLIVKGYRGARRTVMVVDDNAEHREMMRQMLQPLDFTVFTAVDGPDCLTMIESARPDLVFVDILMPGMTGWELVERLREKGFSAPIVMLSANIGDDIAKTNRDAGHNDALAKPFGLRQLLEKIAAQLRLEWIEGVETPVPAAEGNGLCSPGAGHVRELLSLGKIGHVRGIDRKLTELGATPENTPLVERLRAHMEVYDFAGYTKLLESVSEHE